MAGLSKCGAAHDMGTGVAFRKGPQYGREKLLRGVAQFALARNGTCWVTA